MPGPSAKQIEYNEDRKRRVIEQAERHQRNGYRCSLNMFCKHMGRPRPDTKTASRILKEAGLYDLIIGTGEQ